MLTDVQKEFASKNHNLIYKFAHKYDIVLDEYYDVLAIGLCKAAIAFDESKGKFSTLAYKCMLNEFNTNKRHERSRKSVPEDALCSYDSLMCNGKEIAGYTEDDASYEDMISNVEFSEFIDGLNSVDKKILELLMDGMTHSKIGDIIGTTQQNVSYRLKRIRKLLRSFCNC